MILRHLSLFIIAVLLAAPAAAQNAAPVATIDRLDTIGPYIGDCLGRKAREQRLQHRGPREVSWKLHFKADGSLAGEPMRSFSMPDAEQKDQKLFIDDLTRILKSCTPLPFSKELGGAMAGRSYFFRYKLQPRQNPPKQDLRA